MTSLVTLSFFDWLVLVGFAVIGGWQVACWWFKGICRLAEHAADRREAAEKTRQERARVELRREAWREMLENPSAN